MRANALVVAVDRGLFKSVVLSTLFRLISVFKFTDPVIPVTFVKFTAPLNDGEARGAYKLRELLNANVPSVVNQLS